MKAQSCFLLVLLVVCSVLGTGNAEEQPAWNSVQNFFGELWNKVTGKPSDIGGGQHGIKSKTSIEYTLTLVSNDQWDGIADVCEKVTSETAGTLALSQLVEAVRGSLGPTVSNLTDSELGDVIYGLELMKKNSEQQDWIDAVKIFSLNIPLLPVIARDLLTLPTFLR